MGKPCLAGIAPMACGRVGIAWKVQRHHTPHHAHWDGHGCPSECGTRRGSGADSGRPHIHTKFRAGSVSKNAGRGTRT